MQLNSAHKQESNFLKSLLAIYCTNMTTYYQNGLLFRYIANAGAIHVYVLYVFTDFG
jgi:hypothetical protein